MNAIEKLDLLAQRRKISSLLDKIISLEKEDEYDYLNISLKNERDKKIDKYSSEQLSSLLSELQKTANILPCNTVWVRDMKELIKNNRL